jgi:hypothetical protein
LAIDIHQSGVEIFDRVAADLPRLLDLLLAAEAAPVAQHEVIPNTPGVYLFSEQSKPIYVGQTRKLRERLGNHTNPLGKNNQATFAFLVAKAEARNAGVDIMQFRAQLEADQQFAEHFQAAKLRVSEMDVRFTEIPGPIDRSLFEIYAALALDTLVFNSFETH